MKNLFHKGVTMKTKIISLCLSLIFFSHGLYALQERHLIIIRHGEHTLNATREYNTNPKHSGYKVAPLTDKGRSEAKEAAERLLTHGFDNRSIAAVYVSPLPRAVETAEILAEIGVYAKEKIKVDKRLIETQAGNREGLNKDKYTKDSWYVGNHEAKSYGGESSEDVRKRMTAVYDEIEKKHPEGHVVVITHGMPAMELLDMLDQNNIRLSTGEVYVVPLADRNQIA